MLKEYQSMLNQALDSVDVEVLENVKDLLLAYGRNNREILTIGNGGSADISDHWSCDHTKGIQTDTVFNTSVRNLASNMGLVTAIANDIGYDEIFSKQIDWCNRDKVLVIATSSSGSSPNIVKGLLKAKEKQYDTIAFVGFDGGTVLKQQLADHIIHVNSDNYGIIEDSHQILMHVLAQYIRKNYWTGVSALKL